MGNVEGFKKVNPSEPLARSLLKSAVYSASLAVWGGGERKVKEYLNRLPCSPPSFFCVKFSLCG